MEVRNPENTLEIVSPDNLLEHVMEQKNKGHRLSQICVAYANEKLEVSYSFANNDTNGYHTIRLVIDKEIEVYSVTEFYPYAFLYENEMKELFGVNVQMVNLDYQNKLYRINEETPFIKK